MVIKSIMDGFIAQKRFLPDLWKEWICKIGRMAGGERKF